MDLKFYCFWAINAPLDERKLCRQLDQMRGHGYGGVVFHPRYYPGVPAYLSDEYLAIVSRVILHAKSIQLEFWLYDENGWPSGTVGGELLRQFPQHAQQWADLVDAEPTDAIASFEHDGRRWWLARRIGSGVDYFDTAMTCRFIELTYERYRTGLTPEAFAHVSAFFSDEPEFGLGHACDTLSKFGSIPWTPALAEHYQARNSRDLLIDLPALFFESVNAGEARIRFWETCTDVFNDGFTKPLNSWCARQGKRFAAHLKGEEHPLFQVPTNGSCHQFFQHLSLPGIDALERYPSGNFFPRQLVSVAQQFGNGDCMVEAFGGAGWGASPEDLERYLRWLVGHGINHVVLHLWQYELTTHALHDWPSSLPIHMNWREAFATVLDRVRQFAATIDRGADTLFIAPYRGIMSRYQPRELLETNIHNGSNYPATAAADVNDRCLATLDRIHRTGNKYHIADERTVNEHGRVSDGRLHVGRCTYDKVIVAEEAQLSLDLAGLIQQVTSDTPTPAGDRASGRPRRGGIDTSVMWVLAAQPVNQLVLEVQPGNVESFATTFESAGGIEIFVRTLDTPVKITINGTAVDAERKSTTRPGQNRIDLVVGQVDGPPFVSLRGKFLVKNEFGFQEGPRETRSGSGPFNMVSEMTFNAADLLASGYVFCDQPIELECRCKIASGTRCLAFPIIDADAARVWVNGIDLGWGWGPDWRFTLPKDFLHTLVVIRVLIIPSTFNTYGPHHHVDGDLPLVSPVQYQYVKNFADRADAPSNTYVAHRHFKPVGIGPLIRFE